MPTCLDRTSRAQTKAASHLSERPRFDTLLSNYLEYFHRSAGLSKLVQTPSFVVEDVKEIEIEEEEEANDNEIWSMMKEEARVVSERELVLSSYYFASILSHNSLESALASQLSVKLSNSNISRNTLYDIFSNVLKEDVDIKEAVNEDLKAAKERDPACMSYVHCFLNFKGFLACQAQRVSHKLWLQGRKHLALMIQNRVSEVFAVDIHPGAKIGRGVLFDHATGVVVGETTVVGNNTTIFHNVTLGGTGSVSGDRHPKIGDGVLIGAGTNVLGNVKVGEGSKIGAGSVVLKEVIPRSTVIGNPARLVGGKEKS